MQEVVLEQRDTAGKLLKAKFRPDKGMNLVSYSRDGVEVIDPDTKSLFEERAAGLGAVIGPHFHHRPANTLPKIDDTLFPHFSYTKQKQIAEPFSHGIARYVPWQHESGPDFIKASLSGEEKWKQVPLADLEGQNFKMSYEAKLTPEGLQLNLSVVSDSDSLVGFHHYYRLPGGRGRVKASVSNKYRNTEGELEPIPAEWMAAEHQLDLALDRAFDFGFSNYPNPLVSSIILATSEYQLQTDYSSCCEENSWQLFRPEGASYVCIEPLSAFHPKKPMLTVSSLEVVLKIGDVNV